jgi:hypothetical protein
VKTHSLSFGSSFPSIISLLFSRIGAYLLAYLISRSNTSFANSQSISSFSNCNFFKALIRRLRWSGFVKTQQTLDINRFWMNWWLLFGFRSDFLVVVNDFHISWWHLLLNDNRKYQRIWLKMFLKFKLNEKYFWINSAWMSCNSYFETQNTSISVGNAQN